jgi:hypothetical protein
MSSAQPAFGAMFREQIELGVVEINTKPLDARIEWRLKKVWENTSCPSRTRNRPLTRSVSFGHSLRLVSPSSQLS